MTIHPGTLIPEANENRTARRRRAEMLIEIAIALLDEIDGNEDLEETGDLEPYLGWVGAGPDRLSNHDDRESDECERGEPDVDDEPSLGWNDEEASRGRYSELARLSPFVDGELDHGDQPEEINEWGEAATERLC